jgi:hypothetical protein
MAWTLLTPATPQGWQINAMVNQRAFLRAPKKTMDALLRVSPRVWSALPNLRWHVNLVRDSPIAQAQVYIQSPHLVLGGLSPGLRRFKAQLFIYATAGGGGMVRGCLDSIGFKHIEAGAPAYPEWETRIDHTGILRWGIERWGCAQWIKPPTVIGRSGFNGWLSNLWIKT